MNIRLQAASIATILLLTACASPKPYYYWHKENVNQAKTAQVHSFCKEDVGADELSENKANKLVAYCMQSKGFKLVKGYR